MKSLPPGNLERSETNTSDGLAEERHENFDDLERDKDDEDVMADVSKILEKLEKCGKKKEGQNTRNSVGDAQDDGNDDVDEQASEDSSTTSESVDWLNDSGISRR